MAPSPAYPGPCYRRHHILGGADAERFVLPRLDIPGMSDLPQKLRAWANGEARHGIGRKRAALFNEAADRIERLELLRDNQEFLMEYIEYHFPQAMEAAEHALAET